MPIKNLKLKQEDAERSGERHLLKLVMSQKQSRLVPVL